MLLAYMDEIGETGAFVSRDHARYNTSPAFGYAGFIIPSEHARQFGARFAHERKTLFPVAHDGAGHPGRWEVKGADVFRPRTPELFPQQLRVFDALVNSVRSFSGTLFYYADEKSVGTPKQTSLDTQRRESSAMQETLNRIARHAEQRENDILVLMDQVNEKSRVERLPAMYAHILGRSNGFPEMRRIVEPPMHVDSKLSPNIQFADWVSACVSRAIDYQLIEKSAYAWVADRRAIKSVRGAFTHESKLHLHERSIEDLHHSVLFHRDRALYPQVEGQRVGSAATADIMRRMKAAAEKRHH